VLFRTASGKDGRGLFQPGIRSKCRARPVLWDHRRGCGTALRSPSICQGNLASPPQNVRFALLVNTPKRHASWRGSNNMAHSLGLRVQLRMTHEPNHKLADHVFLKVDLNESVFFVTQSAVIKITIERDKSWSV
jgi:hypothetical protein